jgi:hypothetical protein
VKNKNIVNVKNNVYFSVALGLVTNAACHSNEAMKKIVSLLVKFYMVHTLSDCQYPCKKIWLGTLVSVLYIKFGIDFLRRKKLPNIDWKKIVILIIENIILYIKGKNCDL